jgi:hypothetical protein
MIEGLKDKIVIVTGGSGMNGSAKFYCSDSAVRPELKENGL